jgi:hypothetical protein
LLHHQQLEGRGIWCPQDYLVETLLVGHLYPHHLFLHQATEPKCTFVCPIVGPHRFDNGTKRKSFPYIPISTHVTGSTSNISPSCEYCLGNSLIQVLVSLNVINASYKAFCVVPHLFEFSWLQRRHHFIHHISFIETSFTKYLRTGFATTS